MEEELGDERKRCDTSNLRGRGGKEGRNEEEKEKQGKRKERYRGELL